MSKVQTEIRNKIKEDLLDGLLSIRINDTDWKDVDESLLSKTIAIWKDIKSRRFI